jgi:hypothetical protein
VASFAYTAYSWKLGGFRQARQSFACCCCQLSGAEVVSGCCLCCCGCSGKTMLLKALAGQLRGSGGEGLHVSGWAGRTWLEHMLCWLSSGLRLGQGAALLLLH